MTLPSDIRQNLDELATSVEKFFPKEPEKAFEEFIGWGKGNIIASIAFYITWEHLSLKQVKENPLLASRPMRASDLSRFYVN